MKTFMLQILSGQLIGFQSHKIIEKRFQIRSMRGKEREREKEEEKKRKREKERKKERERKKKGKREKER